MSKNKNASNDFRSYWRFYFYGGVSGIHCTENFPQNQVVDKITLEAKKTAIDEFFLKAKNNKIF